MTILERTEQKIKNVERLKAEAAKIHEERLELLKNRYKEFFEALEGFTYKFDGRIFTIEKDTFTLDLTVSEWVIKQRFGDDINIASFDYPFTPPRDNRSYPFNEMISPEELIVFVTNEYFKYVHLNNSTSLQ